VAVVLVIGAVLLMRSYLNLVGQDPGFDTATIVVSVSVPAGTGEAALQETIATTVDELRRLPGVRQAAASLGQMLDGIQNGLNLTVQGRGAFANLKEVTPGFFDAAGLAIVEGRVLRHDDRDSAGIVVNRTFARTHWPDGSAVGKTVGLSTRQVPIVGVVNDAFDAALDAAPRPTAFTYLHDPRSASGGLSFLIRSDGSSDALREPVRRALTSVNPKMAIREYSTVGARLSNSVRDRSFATLMLTLFAVASLSVAVAGIISVVMFTVAGRTREIAIRMAIGAQGHQIRWLVLREVCWAAIAGVVAGGLATRWLSGAMTSLVYGVEAESWVATVVTAAGTVLLMAIASTVPARRALRLQPTVALKVE